MSDTIDLKTNRERVDYLDKLIRERDAAQQRAEAAEKRAAEVTTDLHQVAAAVYPDKATPFTYSVSFMCTEIAALRGKAEDTARLDYLLSLRSPYFIRWESGLIALLETDCGAMIVRGKGKTERDAIDAARQAKEGNRG